jgi:cell division protein FtsA
MSDKSVYAVGLDTGGAFTRCAVCVLEDSELRLIGCGEIPANGWSKGRLADPNAATESIGMAVREAEQAAQISIEAVVVGVGGPDVRGANARSRVELGRPREIQQRDVNRSVERASRVHLQEDRMVLQLFPQDFVVDEHPGHRDPRNMIASAVEANVHLITFSNLAHNALIAAVNQAHFAVEETVFEPIAGSHASVLPDDRREGTAIVDIGAQSTELAVFYGDALQLASSVPVCGDHFTRDVARAFCISFEDAEQLKQEYGSALAGDTPENSLIEVPSPDGRQPREASRRMLNQILEARGEELFHYVRQELERVGMQDALVGGVVLLGGGAKLTGMCDVAERLLNCPARYGLTTGVKDWPRELDDPAWATAAGLAMVSARLKVQAEVERHSIGVLGRMFR